MGVNLGDIPKKQVNLDDLAGKKFAVDAHNTIYQFLSSIRQPDGTLLMDSSGNTTGHLAGIFYRNCKLLENRIKIIYVFDGKPPDFKRNELQKRKEKKIQAQAAWSEALIKGDLENAKKAARATSRLTPEMLSEAKELLSHMGIPVVESPSEGEAQASFLVIDGKADAVSSQDMDCLLFGAPLLLRNLSAGGKRKVLGKNEYVDIYPEFIDLNEVLNGLEISRTKLIWAGILIGTDFDEGVMGIGPKKALSIVRTCNTLNEVVIKAKVPEMLEKFEKIEDFFLNPPINKDINPVFEKFNRQKIIDLLCNKHDFSFERVNRVAERLEEKIKNDSAQTSLSAWS